MELTVPAAVARAARDFGDAEALADPLAGPGGVRFSYRELGERVGHRRPHARPTPGLAHGQGHGRRERVGRHGGHTSPDYS